MPNIIEITNFDAPELDVYARLTENQLLNHHEPDKGMFIAESPKVVERALDAGFEPVSLLLEKKHIDGEAKDVIERVGNVLIFTPECTNPLYRRAIRVSMGTVFQIPWTIMSDDIKEWPNPLMDRIKAHGFKTVAMALRKDTIEIDNPHLKGEDKLAIILGTEGDGLLEETIDGCDYTVKIPMSHGVDSLNVAAASAIVFWELGK